MAEASDALCGHCKAISPYKGRRTSYDIRYRISYNRTDEYPDFPALEASARRGCRLCGLLRHALQDKFSDKKIAETESNYHPSIRAEWPLESNHQVTLGYGQFYLGEGSPEHDTSQTPDQSPNDIHTLSFEVWPYPPRQTVRTRSTLWFSVYADNSK